MRDQARASVCLVFLRVWQETDDERKRAKLTGINTNLEWGTTESNWSSLTWKKRTEKKGSIRFAWLKPSKIFRPESGESWLTKATLLRFSCILSLSFTSGTQLEAPSSSCCSSSFEVGLLLFMILLLFFSSLVSSSTSSGQEISWHLFWRKKKYKTSTDTRLRRRLSLHSSDFSSSRCTCVCLKKRRLIKSLESIFWFRTRECCQYRKPSRSTRRFCFGSLFYCFQEKGQGTQRMRGNRSSSSTTDWKKEGRRSPERHVLRETSENTVMTTGNREWSITSKKVMKQTWKWRNRNREWTTSNFYSCHEQLKYSIMIGFLLDCPTRVSCEEDLRVSTWTFHLSWAKREGIIFLSFCQIQNEWFFSESGLHIVSGHSL